MARLTKKGLEQFIIDVDFFADPRVRKLIDHQGSKAVTIYIILLCNIYNKGYYIRWNEDMLLVLSEQSGCEWVYAQEVVNACINVGLLDKDLYQKEKVLTSKDIQLKYMTAQKLYRRKGAVNEFSLINKDNITNKPHKVVNPISYHRKHAIKPKPSQVEIVIPEEVTTTKATPPTKAPSTLDSEIQEMMSDEIWIDQIMYLHRVDKNFITSMMPFFKAQCIADGKHKHYDLTDAKRHFNNWLRIAINTRQRNGNANNNPYEANREQANKHKLSLAERIQELDARERQRVVVIGSSKEV